MSLRDALGTLLARDARYPIQAYAFVFEALEFAKTRKQRSNVRRRDRDRDSGRERPGRAPNRYAQHVTGQELCHGARELALRQYGLLAVTVLASWGIRSTGDIGEIVYNLIASGDLEKTPTDSRADFDDVYNFEDAFLRDYVFDLDEVA